MAGPGSWFHSQTVAFLGFPFGWDSGAESVNNGYPVPFIKAGIISAKADGPPRRIYVDGHGNPGFSGGPLVFRPLGQPLTVPVIVAGVIIDLPLDPNYRATDGTSAASYRPVPGSLNVRVRGL